MIIKPMSTETTLATATNVNSATVVRLLNTSTATTVTIADGATTIATFTIAANEIVLVEKLPAHTMVAVAAVKAVKVAFTH